MLVNERDGLVSKLEDERNSLQSEVLSLPTPIFFLASVSFPASLSTSITGLLHFTPYIPKVIARHPSCTLWEECGRINENRKPDAWLQIASDS